MLFLVFQLLLLLLVGKCAAQFPFGDMCQSGTQCMSGFCANGLCCAAMCSTCETCTLNGNGVCRPACSAPNGCANSDCTDFDCTATVSGWNGVNCERYNMQHSGYCTATGQCETSMSRAASSRPRSRKQWPPRARRRSVAT